MPTSLRSRSSKVLVYSLVGALIVGMAGFGISDVLSGGSRTDVATVGSSTISQQEYSRALAQALNNTSQQFGQQLTMEQARLRGIDTSTLSQLITSRALENEAAARGVAANDAMLSASIRSTAAFRSTNGTFDSEAYSYALRNASYTVREYETLIRAELSRNLMRPAIVSGAPVDDTAAIALGRFLNEEFSIDWVRIDLDAVALPAPPTDAEQAEWHAANEADYTLPESRTLTIASLSIADLVAQAGVTDDQIAAEYAARLSQYETPERRGIDRLVFADEASASEARARLDAGDVSFDDLITERGVTPDMVSLGLIPATSLNSEARFSVFSLPEPGIVGPVTSDLGPALFRVNAIAAGTTTPLADVAEEIRTQLAQPFVRQTSAETYGKAEELIAAGATIEEVAAEVGMTLSTMEFNADRRDGLAADEKFRIEAAAAELGLDRDLIEADNDSLFALRVDEIIPPSVKPLADVRDEVIAAWTADAHLKALSAQAESLVSQIDAGANFLAMMDTLSLTVANASGLTRGTPSDAIPQAAAAAAFDVPIGGVVQVADGEGYIILHVAGITEASAQSYAEYTARRQAADSNGLADDIYEYFAATVRDNADVEINTPRIEAVINSIR